MTTQESNRALRRAIDNGHLMVLAAIVWLADRIYRPVLDLIDLESCDKECLCHLLDFQGDEGCC